ncbi:hypothetical protein FGO68_gene1085 [Halteria grandinella]|uniref:Uncharacterized protein n=1 Tax=Halteria grandinella TaxID=5974 RepID=A0A8J8T685_HALGN|nr:hypothetical protein FGO68_gene1085 [Halteria grandinella]
MIPKASTKLIVSQAAPPQYSRQKLSPRIKQKHLFSSTGESKKTLTYSRPASALSASQKFQMINLGASGIPKIPTPSALKDDGKHFTSLQSARFERKLSKHRFAETSQRLMECNDIKVDSSLKPLQVIKDQLVLLSPTQTTKLQYYNNYSSRNESQTLPQSTASSGQVFSNFRSKRDFAKTQKLSQNREADQAPCQRNLSEYGLLTNFKTCAESPKERKKWIQQQPPVKSIVKLRQITLATDQPIQQSLIMKVKHLKVAKPNCDTSDCNIMSISEIPIPEQKPVFLDESPGKWQKKVKQNQKENQNDRIGKGKKTLLQKKTSDLVSNSSNKRTNQGLLSPLSSKISPLNSPKHPKFTSSKKPSIISHSRPGSNQLILAELTNKLFPQNLKKSSASKHSQKKSEDQVSSRLSSPRPKIMTARPSVNEMKLYFGDHRKEVVADKVKKREIHDYKKMSDLNLKSKRQSLEKDESCPLPEKLSTLMFRKFEFPSSETHQEYPQFLQTQSRNNNRFIQESSSCNNQEHRKSTVFFYDQVDIGALGGLTLLTDIDQTQCCPPPQTLPQKFTQERRYSEVDQEIETILRFDNQQQ